MEQQHSFLMLREPLADHPPLLSEPQSEPELLSELLSEPQSELVWEPQLELQSELLSEPQLALVLAMALERSNGRTLAGTTNQKCKSCKLSHPYWTCTCQQRSLCMPIAQLGFGIFPQGIVGTCPFYYCLICTCPSHKADMLGHTNRRNSGILPRRLSGMTRGLCR